jgi:hypothetical protein
MALLSFLVPTVNMPLKVAAGQDRTRPGQEREFPRGQQ